MRLPSKITQLVVCAHAAVLFAVPTFALDVQGTWNGQMVCKGFDGDKYVLKWENSVLKITQTGNAIVVDFNSGSYVYAGNAIPDIEDATVGEIGMTLCTPGSMEVGRASIRNEKLRGLSLWRDSESHETCKWSYKRVSTADPGVTCP